MAKPKEFSFTREDIAIAINKSVAQVEELESEGDFDFENPLSLVFFIAANAPQTLRQNIVITIFGMVELDPDLWTPKKKKKGKARTFFCYTLKDISQAGGMTVNAIYQHQYRGYVDPEQILSLPFYFALYASGDVRHKIVNVCMGMQEATPDLWERKKK